MNGNVAERIRGGKLCSLEEWIGILNSFKKENRKCETNCYVPLAVQEEYIREGRLFYERIPDGPLWLFELERDYYLGYYYVSKEEDLYIKPQDLDVVIYLIGSEKKYPVKREEELIVQGCVKYRRNLEYMLTSEKVPELIKMDQKCWRFLKKMELHYTAFQEKDYEAVFWLWRERIDKYSVKDMLKSRIHRMEERKECFIIRDKEENIVAACVFEINGSVGLSENVAVVKSCNGMGIGGVLLCRSFMEIFTRGSIKDHVWVWENNTESRKITERFADLTGKFSQQLLLKRRGDKL